jgi:hypothetical protein
MRMNRFAGATAALAALALVVSCHKSSDETGSSATGTTDGYISGVSISGVSGAYTALAAPAATGGPAVSIGGNATVVNGGTNQVTVASTDTTTAIARVYVWVSGLTGYYDVALPAPGTSTTLLVSYAQAPPTTSFTFSVAGVTSSGTVGAAVTQATLITTVGTGDVQVNLSWDVNSDLDIHVVEPSGDEVYWNSRISPSGGKLDLDSNAACNLDGYKNENVTWPTGAAKRGTYTVRVDHWSNCTQTATNYVVRVNQNGTSTTYTGTVTGKGDQGGRGSGTTVTTFAY